MSYGNTALLDYTIYPQLASEACTLCMCYCQAGLLDPATLLPWLGNVLAVYGQRRDILLPAQRSRGVAWMWEDGYWRPRQEAADLLALLGYFDSPEAESELRRALVFRDPLLRCAAVISLLRQEKRVDPQHVDAATASAEVRGELWDRLSELGKLSLYPERFRTQEALAESSMVKWLTSFTELDRVPDRIELMKVVPVDTGTPDGYLDYYVFRFRTFRPHWAARRGWIAGVAGPYLRKEAPTTSAYGYTFSDFTSWDSMSPEEHVGAVQEVIERFFEYQTRQAKQSDSTADAHPQSAGPAESHGGTLERSDPREREA